jgi:Na+-translocating ferredoxin:NAD+ oxidoreductase RnfD subunit
MQWAYFVICDKESALITDRGKFQRFAGILASVIEMLRRK